MDVDVILDVELFLLDRKFKDLKEYIDTFVKAQKNLLLQESVILRDCIDELSSEIRFRVRDVNRLILEQQVKTSQECQEDHWFEGVCDGNNPSD